MFWRGESRYIGHTNATIYLLSFLTYSNDWMSLGSEVTGSIALPLWAYHCCPLPNPCLWQIEICLIDANALCWNLHLHQHSQLFHIVCNGKAFLFCSRFLYDRIHCIFAMYIAVQYRIQVFLAFWLYTPPSAWAGRNSKSSKNTSPFFLFVLFSLCLSDPQEQCLLDG